MSDLDGLIERLTAGPFPGDRDGTASLMREAATALKWLRAVEAIFPCMAATRLEELAAGQKAGADATP